MIDRNPVFDSILSANYRMRYPFIGDMAIEIYERSNETIMADREAAKKESEFETFRGALLKAKQIPGYEPF